MLDRENNSNTLSVNAKKRKMEKKVSVFKNIQTVWAKRKWYGKHDLEHGSDSGLRRVVDRPVFALAPFLHQNDSNKPGKSAIASS